MKHLPPWLGSLAQRFSFRFWERKHTRTRTCSHKKEVSFLNFEKVEENTPTTKYDFSKKKANVQKKKKKSRSAAWKDSFWLRTRSWKKILLVSKTPKLRKHLREPGGVVGSAKFQIPDCRRTYDCSPWKAVEKCRWLLF